MAQRVSRVQAERVRAAVSRRYGGSGFSEPTTLPGDHEGLGAGAFVISWEEGPDDWPLEAQHDLPGCPVYVRVEAVNHWCLGVFPR